MNISSLLFEGELAGNTSNLSERFHNDWVRVVSSFMFSQSIGAEDYETFGDDLSQGVPLPTIIIIVLGVYLLLVLIVVAGKQPKHKESFELWPINYIESFCNLMDWSIKDHFSFADFFIAHFQT